MELVHLLCVKASTIHVRGRGQLKPYSYISKEAPQNKKYKKRIDVLSE